MERNHKLLRCSFDDALDLFPDNYFDFIYIDGFAHTGEEGGKTLVDWYKKLKTGGLMAGDDYHEDWPLVMWAVNYFANTLDLQITLTSQPLDDKYSRYPTWFLKKTSEPTYPIPLDTRLTFIAQKERKRIHKLRTSSFSGIMKKILRLVKNIIRNDSKIPPERP